MSSASSGVTAKPRCGSEVTGPRIEGAERLPHGDPARLEESASSSCRRRAPGSRAPDRMALRTASRTSSWAVSSRREPSSMVSGAIRWRLGRGATSSPELLIRTSRAHRHHASIDQRRLDAQPLDLRSGAKGTDPSTTRSARAPARAGRAVCLPSAVPARSCAPARHRSRDGLLRTRVRPPARRSTAAAMARKGLPGRSADRC